MKHAALVSICLILVALLYFGYRNTSGPSYFTWWEPSPNTAVDLPQATAESLREAVVFWKDEITKRGPENAYKNFIETASISPIPPHEHSHAFGEALYSVEGLSGLGYCDSSFEFGCYHSFFGVAVAEKGISVLPEFAEACKTKYGDYNLPCEHGIGHGVLVYTDYENLEKALELCTTISDLPTGGCSSGVLMENNFHTMDESVGSSYIRPKTDDIYAPCNTLPERFQASCYLEQVQWWQNIYSNDFTYIGTLCNELPENSDVYEACFHGVGNYLAANAVLDVDKIIVGCRLMPGVKPQALCNEGASWLVRGDGSKVDDAIEICRVLEGSLQERCLRSLR